jgi:hypothetical protein
LQQRTRVQGDHKTDKEKLEHGFSGFKWADS